MMGWKGIGKELGWIVVPSGLCLGALLLHARAWHRGYSNPELGVLMGCQGVSFFILLAAWVWVSIVLFTIQVKKEKSTDGRLGTTTALFLTVSGCFGCYPLWPVVLFLVALLLMPLTSRRKDSLGPNWRIVVLRAGITALLFTLTWYLCATVKKQALHGFGERIEAMVGEDHLIGWATEVIAARQQGKPQDANTAPLAREEVPNFIHDLMGGEPKRTHVEVHIDGKNAYVTVTNSAQEAFRITIRPSRVAHDPGSFLPHWWVKESAGFEWRPGIDLDTLGNFR